MKLDLFSIFMPCSGNNHNDTCLVLPSTLAPREEEELVPPLRDRALPLFLLIAAYALSL